MIVQVEANFEKLTMLYATFASMGLPKYGFFKARLCKYTFEYFRGSWGQDILPILCKRYNIKNTKLKVQKVGCLSLLDLTYHIIIHGRPGQASKLQSYAQQPHMGGNWHSDPKAPGARAGNP